MTTPVDDAGSQISDDAFSSGTGGSAGGTKSDASEADPPGIFVAVGYGGRTVRSIDDGATWIDDDSIVAQGGDDKNLLTVSESGASCCGGSACGTGN